MHLSARRNPSGSAFVYVVVVAAAAVVVGIVQSPDTRLFRWANRALRDPLRTRERD